MIESLFFYANGHLAALQSSGDQIPEESEPWYFQFLRMLLAAGLADDRTLVSIPGFYSGPLLSLRIQHRLPPAVGDNPGKVAMLAFHPNGKTECVGLDGGHLPALEIPWYIPAIKDKLDRGVATPATMVRVPGAFYGTISQLFPANSANSGTNPEKI